MKIKLSMLLMSHLSDLQEDSFLTPQGKNSRINFVKFLILKYSDLNTEVEPNIEWKAFEAKHPNLAIF